MKKIWINKPKSFKEAEDFNRKYYAQMTPEERLSIMQELREIYPKFSRKNQKRSNTHEIRRRLQRIVKIIQ